MTVQVTDTMICFIN